MVCVKGIYPSMAIAVVLEPYDGKKSRHVVKHVHVYYIYNLIHTSFMFS